MIEVSHLISSIIIRNKDIYVGMRMATKRYVPSTDGKRNGYAYKWHENGQLASKIFYDLNGLEQGERIAWHDNGQTSLKGQFVDGIAMETG